MNQPDVDAIIDEVQQLARVLESLPEVADAQMALMYLRHLRRSRRDLVNAA